MCAFNAPLFVHCLSVCYIERRRSISPREVIMFQPMYAAQINFTFVTDLTRILARFPTSDDLAVFFIFFTLTKMDNAMLP